MAFIKFENRNERVEERITVTKSNTIGFPSKFFTDNSVKDFKYVVLFWDPESKEIGILFSNDEAEKNNAFKISKSKIGYGGFIIARSFFRHNKIDTTTYYNRYEWKKVPYENNTELFVIKLEARAK